MKRILLALALLLPTSAFAQCNGVFANNTVCGNITGSSNLPRPTNPSAFLGAAGGTNGQIQYNNGGALGGFTASGDATVNTSTGVVTIQPGVVTSSKLAANAIPLISTRAVAATLNLSAFSVVQTQGYSTAGDGGGATFRKLSSGNFVDSYITTKTITGGSGYTNGTFYGVIYTGGGLNNIYAIGTATVAGGIVTAVDISGTPANSCSVGGVWTTSSLAGGTGHSFTVTGCSPAKASFTDSAGNKFQFVPTGFPNILQFGAKGDWDGVDASATDNFDAIQSASWFASNKSAFSFDQGGYWGGRVIFPSGSYMACGTGSVPLVISQSVTFEGANEAGGSTIRACGTFSNGVHFIELCDPNWHFACFNATLREISISGPSVGQTNGSAMIHSNNVQDFGGLDRVYVYGGDKTCVWFETGYGGASMVMLKDLSCNSASDGPMVKIGNTLASGLNYGTTVISMTNIALGGPSSGGNYQTGPGMLLQGGQITVTNVHCEAMPICITLDMETGGGFTHQAGIHNVNAGSGAPAPTCTGVIALAGTNNPGNAIIGRISTRGSCTNTITNGQPGGVNLTTAIAKDVVCTTTCS